MLKDALEFLVGLGDKVRQPHTLELPGNRLLVVRPDQSVDVLDKDRLVRADYVGSLKSLIDWVLPRGDGVDVWVRAKEVAAIDNPTDPTRRDQATLALTHSKAWMTLDMWNGRATKHKEAVRLLRGPLADTFDDLHLRVFRSLDFTRRNDGSRSVSHVGESLGRSIETLAQGKDGAVPERIAFQVPVFDFEESPKVTIVMAVEVDPEAETVCLFAVGDAFKQGERTALAAIKRELDENLPGAHVYLG